MNQTSPIVPVILSGGAGTRLWPMSRSMYPKQFIPLAGALSLLQQTCRRLNGVGTGSLLVVCNNEHRFLVAEQLRQVQAESPTILLEPVGRNTAPAIAAAALIARERDEDAVLVVLPADHVVRDLEAFERSVAVAIEAANRGALVTFGVVPSRPETGYGYIRAAARAASSSPVAEFVEKPDVATAERYVASGDYYWKSGMFVFRARDYLEEL